MMKKSVAVILLTSFFLLAERRAITDNKVEVILKDDSTWVAVDSLANQISPFAITEDSQTVYLKDDGTWEHMESDRVDVDVVPAIILPQGKYERKVPEIDIEIVPYNKVEVKPKPIYSPVPDYPYMAKIKGIMGMTVVKMLIDIDGTIAEVEILKTSGNQELDEAALKAAKKSIFSPAEHKGKKVRVWASRPFKFKLH
jgi:TonB family protein